MLKSVILPVAGIVLLVICCAGPVLLAGAGASVALTIARAQLPIIIAPLAIVAVIAAGLVFLARRSKARVGGSGVQR